MKLNNEKWIAAYKKAVSDTKMPATSGLVCALATLRVIRDGLLDDVGFDVSKPMGAAGEENEDSPEAMAIREGVNELIKQLVSKDVPGLKGFASNASAAGKAAGFKGSETIVLDAIVE